MQMKEVVCNTTEVEIKKKVVNFTTQAAQEVFKEKFSFAL
jgi:hypothetical protein